MTKIMRYFTATAAAAALFPGFSLRKSGKFEDAIRHYKRALEINPRFEEAHEYMGEAYLGIGDRESAWKRCTVLKGLGSEEAEEPLAKIPEYDARPPGAPAPKRQPRLTAGGQKYTLTGMNGNKKGKSLMPIAHGDGKLRMMGIGAVDSLGKMLAAAGRGVKDDDLKGFKEIVARELGGEFSAVSVDPLFGYPSCERHLRGKTGLILSVQSPGYELAGPGGRERRASFLDVWKSGAIGGFGADAVKLTIHYRGDLSPETKEHQKSMAREVGAWCRSRKELYILEIMSYQAGGEEESDPRRYALRLPGIVIDFAREFSAPEYAADLLKIDFPADLKHCAGYEGRFEGAEAAVAGGAQNPAYTLSEVESFCREITRASSVPWVILSGGVGIEEFIERVRIASSNGAAGFLGGRPIWAGAARLYPDEERMTLWLRSEGKRNAAFLREASR